MVSNFRQALESKDSSYTDRVISKRVASISRGSQNESPDLFNDEGEANRIEEDYIKEKYKKLIINKASANKVMRTLITDPETGLKTDFNNLMTGAGKEGRNVFINFLFDKFVKPKIEKVNESEVELKSKQTRKGIKVNSLVYLIATKKGIKARSFKTGQFVQMKKHYLDVFDD